MSAVFTGTCFYYKYSAIKGAFKTKPSHFHYYEDPDVFVEVARLGTLTLFGIHRAAPDSYLSYKTRDGMKIGKVPALKENQGAFNVKNMSMETGDERLKTGAMSYWIQLWDHGVTKLTPSTALKLGFTTDAERDRAKSALRRVGCKLGSMSNLSDFNSSSDGPSHLPDHHVKSPYSPKPADDSRFPSPGSRVPTYPGGSGNHEIVNSNQKRISELEKEVSELKSELALLKKLIMMSK